jgi:hypothetical protein
MQSLVLPEREISQVFRQTPISWDIQQGPEKRTLD